MTANLHQPAPQKMANQGKQNGDRDSHWDNEAERSNSSLHRMWEIVRNRPYAVLESIAGDAKVDNIQVAIWRNHLLERSCTAKLADHTISLQLSGQPVKRVDKKKTGVVPGRFVILPVQSVSAWQSEGSTQFAHLYFTPKFLSQLAASAFDANPDRFELIEGEMIQDHQVQRLTTSAIELFSNTVQPLPLETNSLAQVLGVHLIRHYSNLFPTPEPFNRERLNPAQLETVIEYIDENLERSLTVQELADLLHLGQYHFLRAFRNTLDQTPRRYVLHRRVSKAQDLIRQGKMSLADIAYHLGFSSQSHLSTAFKQVTGTTPSQFQRLV